MSTILFAKSPWFASVHSQQIANLFSNGIMIHLCHLLNSSQTPIYLPISFHFTQLKSTTLEITETNIIAQNDPSHPPSYLTTLFPAKMCIVWDRHFTECTCVQKTNEYVRCFSFRHKLPCKGDEVKIIEVKGECETSREKAYKASERATMARFVDQIWGHERLRKDDGG